MMSYQCSPMSTSDGIVNVFKQCAALQKSVNGQCRKCRRQSGQSCSECRKRQDTKLQKYTSVVVLDEIGLAEDSPKMPLKVKNK